MPARDPAQAPNLGETDLLDVLIALGIMWLLAYLTHRYLIREAGLLASLLVAFAFALLAPILHLFLSVCAAAIFATGFDPDSWFSTIPLVAASSGIIAYITVRTKTNPPSDDDGHIERKF